MQIKLCDIIAKLGAEVINPTQEETGIKGLASLSGAGPDELSFYHDGRYLNDLKVTKAAAVLVPRPAGLAARDEMQRVPLRVQHDPRPLAPHHLDVLTVVETDAHVVRVG